MQLTQLLLEGYLYVLHASQRGSSSLVKPAQGGGWFASSKAASRMHNRWDTLFVADEHTSASAVSYEHIYSNSFVFSYVCIKGDYMDISASIRGSAPSLSSISKMHVAIAAVSAVRVPGSSRLGVLHVYQA